MKQQNRTAYESLGFALSATLATVILGTSLAACGGSTAPTSSRAGAAGTSASTNVGSTDTAMARAMAGARPDSSGLIVSASSRPTSPSKNGSGTAGPVASDTCASGMQTTSPVTPTVWLVVDGSSSMNEDFESGSSRWLALRSTLMDVGGVVDTLQAFVRFGLVIYAGGDPTNCVQLVTVEPALDNLAAMAARYPMSPLASGTPTDKALDYVVNNLPVLNDGVLDQTNGPVYVVLATDGAPNDNCGTGGRNRQGNNANVAQRVVDITAQGAMGGMQMFVISMAGGDSALQSHLEMVGAATVSKTPPFVPTTKGDLIATFQKIVGGASCLVSLDGSVVEHSECAGTVQLNTVALPCNDPDGWSLFNRSTVQLEGRACDMFLAQQSMVIAKFPCDVWSPN